MKLLTQEYRDPEKPCINCRFYFRNMKQHEVPFLKRQLDINEHEYGQKLCVKNNSFVYFNESCQSFSDL